MIDPGDTCSGEADHGPDPMKHTDPEATYDLPDCRDDGLAVPEAGP